MSNAGPGESPNKQAQHGKVAATNRADQTVSIGYRSSGGDGRQATHGSLPAGSLSASATGVPQNTGPRPGNGLKLFNTRQPKNADRALGTPGRLTGR